MSITRKSLAHLAMVAAGGLSLSACATTDYVDEQIAAVNQRIDGVEATAQLLAQLCEALAEDYDVTVVTGHLYGHELPAEEVRNGVRIVRVRSTAYERSQIHLRAANYASYLGDTVLTALRGGRPDLVLCMTDPPIVGDVGLVVARRFGVPLLVISQDVFPEIAERLKRLEHPVVLGVLRQLVALYLRRADRVVAIGETMKKRLEQKGAPANRVTVIPNWVDTSELEPQRRHNVWSAEQGVDDAFVVMHSGNVGHAQDLDTLVRAATFLRDLDRLRILVVDDNPESANSLGLLMKLVGHDVRIAYNGPTALETLRTFQPQVLLQDIQMPGMSGYEVVQRIREQSATMPVVLVALTGYGSDQDRRRCLDAGFDHHLVKPVDLHALQQLLASIVLPA